MKRPSLPALLALALLLPPPASADPRPRDIMDGAELRLALRRVQVLGTALYVGAHPDDENTAFLSYLESGRMVRAAYLSLTRGDGGQNLVGAETGEQLGVIRTQELVAARRVDGAEQYFTRALDFGYSKNPDETLAIWGHDRILADVVWVIRKLKPDVIVTRFGTDGSGGHGHHTASAILAGEAFRAAADPARFPEQLREVSVWQAKRLLWNNFRPRTEGRDPALPPLVTIDLGAYNPLLGRSYSEVAGQSRSMHKSQGFGAPERRGAIPNTFEHVDGEAAKADLFDGVDLTWRRVMGGVRVGELLDQAERAFDPDHPAASLPLLVQAYTVLRSIPSEPVVVAKRREVLALIRSCAGLWFEANAATASATPGSHLKVTFSVLNRSDAPFRLDRIELPFGAVARLAPEARADSAARPEAAGVTLASNRTVSADAMLALPPDLPLTQPYWLEKRALKGSFELGVPALLGEPENPPALTARFVLSVKDVPVEFDVPVVYRWVDPVQGERYRSLVIAPPVTCRFDREVYLFPDLAPREIRVTVEGADSTRGVARLRLPEGWRAVPAEVPLQLASARELRFTVTPASGPAAASVSAEVQIGGARYGYRRVEIDHPHIPIQTLFPPAEARLVRADVKHAGDAVGYVMGSGDRVPEALGQMGFHVTLLSDDDLERLDLQRFGAIVVGVRAYNTRPRLRTLEPRLLDYARAGGRLVVQYQTPEEALNGRLGPWPFTIARDRVTVEEAEMRVLKPGHPLLVAPNRIGPGDFDGWVQERGVNYVNPWDPRYETPLSANDPGEKPLDGGLIFARLGKGAYVYTSLAWFRQLPAGVPGAYRLFANLVSATR